MAALAHLYPVAVDAPPDNRPKGSLLQRIRCAVCGGPEPDGSGCEYCPAVSATAEVDS